MLKNAPSKVYLKDYQAPDFYILATDLIFELTNHLTCVSSTLTIRRQGAHSRSLRLHGQDLKLINISLNRVALDAHAYILTEEGLEIPHVPDEFVLFTQVEIDPIHNTRLEGLYASRGLFCTQCEAEGFRKITYYLDRPDVLSLFSTRIIADPVEFPVLLSNGNCVASGQLEDGRHFAYWQDPFPKPAYLFALVAGKLDYLQSNYITRSGRSVDLRIYVETKDLDKCDHAMASLKKAMRWDEDVYGREYDLDLFMIVAVDDFNMGAMENKGLNIFNTACVLAHQSTTLDASFERVESIVAHEYFHNWSGNRVTCRDWFQLSLKEGFTVFRDAEFSADMGSRSVKRIEDVQHLRTQQFAEDAGPLAHPVQPPDFIEISNFYTLTIYEKGAEIVRMLHCLLGPEIFRKATDLYFDHFDGQAVTIEDFVQCMEHVSGRNLTQFMHWYRFAGTPVLDILDVYDEIKQTYTLTVKQHCPSTPEASSDQKPPFHLPLALGLLGKSGPMPLKLKESSKQIIDQDQTSIILEIYNAHQTFEFTQVTERPVPSLLRHFSAPVRFNYNYDSQDLQRIISVDDDGFSRWNAAQMLALKAMEMDDSTTHVTRTLLLQSWTDVLNSPITDPALVAYLIELPSESYMAEQQTCVDVDGNWQVRETLKAWLAHEFQDVFYKLYNRCVEEIIELGDIPNGKVIGWRLLKQKILSYLALLSDEISSSLILHQYHSANNMTDALSALTLIIHSGRPEFDAHKSELIELFRLRWQHETLVMNYWLSMQASNPLPGTLNRIKHLFQSPVYDAKNPNKIRSLVSVFANQNHIQFHALDGTGYQFLSEQVIALNTINPQLAARLTLPLTKWKRYASIRQNLMKQALNHIFNEPNLSKDVFEVVSKALEV